MGYKILLADDSITVQKVIELTFADKGFELHTVETGQEVVKQIREIAPDIVLCDIAIPGTSGYAVCEFIYSNADLKHIPVLLLTSVADSFDHQRAQAFGCENVLRKPFEPHILISKVMKLIGESTETTTALVENVSDWPITKKQVGDKMNSAIKIDEDELVERIVQRVIYKLSDKVVKEIVKEVVPDIAENMIREEIDALKTKMQESG